MFERSINVAMYKKTVLPHILPPKICFISFDIMSSLSKLHHKQDNDNGHVTFHLICSLSICKRSDLREPTFL